MWHQGKGNWEEAHRLAQSENSPNGRWVHAHLHRVEGDLGNAAYWYRLADRPICTSSLDDEWEEIVTWRKTQCHNSRCYISTGHDIDMAEHVIYLCKRHNHLAREQYVLKLVGVEHLFGCPANHHGSEGKR